MMTPDESNQAEIRLLRRQLAEQTAALDMIARTVIPLEGEAVQDAVFRAIDSRDAALAVLASLVIQLAPGDAYSCKLCRPSTGVHSLGCPVRQALAPDFVQQAIEEHRKTQAVVGLVKAELALATKASQYLAGEPATIGFFTRKLKALLGEEAQAVSDPLLPLDSTIREEA